MFPRSALRVPPRRLDTQRHHSESVERPVVRRTRTAEPLLQREAARTRVQLDRAAQRDVVLG
jgi:hypothetical protein